MRKKDRSGFKYLPHSRKDYVRIGNDCRDYMDCLCFNFASLQVIAIQNVRFVNEFIVRPISNEFANCSIATVCYSNMDYSDSCDWPDSINNRVFR